MISDSPGRQDMRRMRARMMFLRLGNLAKRTSPPPVLRTPARIFSFRGEKPVIGPHGEASLDRRVSDGDA